MSRYNSDLYTIDRDVEIFNQYQEKFDEYPMVIIDANDENIFINRYQFGLRDHFAKLCKQHGYTHIVIYKHSYRYDMIVPRNKNTGQLVGSLLLVAGKDAISVTTKARSWTFTFRRDDGEKMFMHWIEQCKTDTLYRLILRFAPKE